RYASRFSVRALDLSLDSSALWVGVILALVSAVLLAYVPRLPSSDASNGLGLAGSSLRITGGTKRRLRAFAVVQIAAPFVLLAGRDFNDADRNGGERVVIVNSRVAKELFPGQDPINRHMQITDAVARFAGINTDPRRIVGVVADVDDEHIEAKPSMMFYTPVD